jgi:hypothetical protein
MATVATIGYLLTRPKVTGPGFNMDQNIIIIVSISTLVIVAVIVAKIVWFVKISKKDEGNKG